MAEKKAAKSSAPKKAKAPKKEKAEVAVSSKSAKSSDPQTIKFQAFTICKKRSGRYEVLNAKGKNVNGADKTKVLLDAKLIAASLPKPAEAAPQETPPENT